jgi:arylsulfatase A-like enzyme
MTSSEARARAPVGSLAVTRRRSRSAWLALAALVCAVCAAGDGPPAEPLALQGRLRELVAAGQFGLGRSGPAALRFATSPQLATVGVDGERREAVVTAAGSWWWRGEVPASARLMGAVQAVGGSGAGGGELVVTVSGVLPLERRVLARVRGGAGWVPLTADLSPLAGREIELEVTAEVRGGSGVTAIGWAPFELMPAGAGDQRPNVVLVLVDTLRADRLGTYGARRRTSPNLDALLARRGVVVEQAYAQAPWTLPSMMGLLAGRWPGRLLDPAQSSFALPTGAPTLPTELRRLGYETAAFIGNPTLHAGNGFARGFATFYSPPMTPQAFEQQSAEHLTGLARRWLAANRQRPFFLYVHYVDPHDPYDNADLAGGRSVFDPEYRGEVSGSWVHGIYLGKVALPDPAADVNHLRALYDSEIRYFDRHLAELLRGFDRDTLANTLFVFTSDHGEELYDHRGWKHGRTLYEEQLRVPLVLRWDRGLPSGARVPGPVRLLDVAPTLVAAAGGTPPATWDGHDLLPALRGERPLPPGGPLFAQHFADGPTRAAVRAGRWKLVAFDRHAPFVPPNEHERLLWEQERRRLRRLELYDLAADPGERRDLVATRPDVVRRLAPVLHRRLAEQRPGLRVLLAGGGEPGRVEVVVRLHRPPASWSPLFLAAEDQVHVDGGEVSLSLLAESFPKGITLAVSAEEVAAIAAVRGGESVPVVLGDGTRHAGGAVPAGALAGEAWPGGDGTGSEVLLWLPPAGAPAPSAADDEETRRRLQALGYAG